MTETMVAIGFPGQGPHEPDKLNRLINQFPAASEVVQNAEEILNTRLIHLLIGERDSAKTTTRDDQLRLYLGSVALWIVAEQRGVVSEPKERRIFYGASAGEIAGLWAAGSYDFARGLELINTRGEEMHKAAIANPGEMFVASGLPFDEAMEIADGIPGVYAVNDNPGQQSVFSGTGEAVGQAYEKISELWQGVKLHKTDIKIAAHTELMVPAMKGFKRAVLRANVNRPTHPFMGNQAKLLKSSRKTRQHLVKQLKRPVRLRESAQRLYDDFNVRTFYDVGPGRVLSGQMRREFRKLVQVISIMDELLPEKE